MANNRTVSRPPRPPIAVVALVIAATPAVVMGLAAEAWQLAGAPASSVGPLVQVMPLVALPLAGLLLLVATRAVRRRGRQLADLRAQADQACSRLDAVIDATWDAIVLLGRDGGIEVWPPTAAELYQLSADEACALTFDSLVDPADAARSRAAFARVVASGGRERMRAIHRRGRGQTFAADVSWAAVRDGDGGIIGVSLAVRDAGAETVAASRLALAERRVRLLFESSIDAVLKADRSGRVVGWNLAAARLFGWSADEALGRPLEDVLRCVGGTAAWSVELAGAGQPARLTAVRSDGNAFEADVVIATLEDDPSAPYLVIVRDVSDRPAVTPGAEGDTPEGLEGDASQAPASGASQAAESDTPQRTLVDHLPGVVYASPVGRWAPVEYVSPQVLDLLGYRADEWVGVPGMWEQHVHPDDLRRVLADDTSEIRSEDPNRTDREYRMRRRDGREIWVRDHVVLDVDSDGRPVRRHGYLTDITERKRLEAELVRLAFHDPLTGLANRALLNDRVAHALARSERDPGLVAMLLIDVDDFKRINDTHGHEVGDRLLVAVARRLREVVRSGATVARLGGDEFAVLIEGLAEEASALGIAQRVVNAFEEPFKIEGLQLGARLSVGVAVDITHQRSPAWLLRAADLAMYEAKGLGKGRWRVYDPQAHLASARRLVLESELRRAVDRHQFVLHYQPVRDFGTGLIVGSEALLRWNHPKRGLVGPTEIIPTLESTGLIGEVGRWVVDEACRQAADWATRLPSVRWTAVNVSAAQLRGEAFVQFVRDSIQRHGLDAGRLSIEITESLALDDSSDTAELLRRLRDLGARIAVDDFGTGYSSLAYLRRLPIDRIKIDRSFVQGVGTDPEATAVARVIVELARSLHLSTVAEGIEDAIQAQALAEMGCDMGQGFLLAKPLEPAAFVALVQAQQQHRELAAAS